MEQTTETFPQEPLAPQFDPDLPKQVAAQLLRLIDQKCQGERIANRSILHLTIVFEKGRHLSFLRGRPHGTQGGEPCLPADPPFASISVICVTHGVTISSNIS